MYIPFFYIYVSTRCCETQKKGTRRICENGVDEAMVISRIGKGGVLDAENGARCKTPTILLQGASNLNACMGIFETALKVGSN